MLISIVVPTYQFMLRCLQNDSTVTQLLPEPGFTCLEAIRRTTDLSSVEVVVVANGCSDMKRVADYVNSLGRPFRLLCFPESLGYTRASNEGIKASFGDYVVLLNDDAFLLPQPKNQWLQVLLEPFVNKRVGLTGPHILGSQETGKEFIVFFLAMIRRSLFGEIGLLDEQFNPGAGEDTDFCIRAMEHGYIIEQVPYTHPVKWEAEIGLPVGQFPVYHPSNQTVARDVPGWAESFKRNGELLKARYAGLRNAQQKQLGGDFERPVNGRNDVPARHEDARMKWMRERVTGSRMFDLGCSSGFALKYLRDIPELKYVGVDYDRRIVEFAIKEFGDLGKFINDKVDANFLKAWDSKNFDTVMIFELLEHLEDGREMAQMLREQFSHVLASSPYNEPPGFWGPHHKLHRLFPEDFPGYVVKYLNVDTCEITDKPDEDNAPTLMLLEWRKDG